QSPPLRIPTVPGALNDVQPQLAQIIQRIGKVRFDRIGEQLESTLSNADSAAQGLRQTLTSARAAIDQLTPQPQKALADTRQTLQGAEQTLANFDRNLMQSDAPLQRHANEALLELQRAAKALRELSDYLQQHPESILRGKAADPAPAQLSGAQR